MTHVTLEITYYPNNIFPLFVRSKSGERIRILTELLIKDVSSRLRDKVCCEEDIQPIYIEAKNGRKYQDTYISKNFQGCLRVYSRGHQVRGQLCKLGKLAIFYHAKTKNEIFSFSIVFLSKKGGYNQPPPSKKHNFNPSSF